MELAKKKRSKSSVEPASRKRVELDSEKCLSAGASRLDKYRAKLEGAKFRLLNESLYAGKQQEITERDFEEYHTGFKRQVERWPTNPVQVILANLRKRVERVGSKKSSWPRVIRVGDFGCGDAEIGHSLKEDDRFDVSSFDLVSKDEAVIVADVSKSVPLEDACLDIGIFSLSLMNRDVTSYLVEAFRVLKDGGELLVAEVKSRFSEEEGGGDARQAMESGLEKFNSEMQMLGFKLMNMDENSNKMFVLFKFRKIPALVKPGARVVLKSCPYKRR